MNLKIFSSSKFSLILLYSLFICILLTCTLYLRPSPIGLAFVFDPMNYIPHSILQSARTFALIYLVFICAAFIFRPFGQVLLLFYGAVNSLLLLLTAVDHELQRFMGIRFSYDWYKTYVSFTTPPESILQAIQEDQAGPFYIAALIIAGTSVLFVTYLAHKNKITLPFIKWKSDVIIIVTLLTFFIGATYYWNEVATPIRKQKSKPVLELLFDNSFNNSNSNATIEPDRLSALVKWYQHSWLKNDQENKWYFPSKKLPFFKKSKEPCELESDSLKPNFIIIQLETFRAMNIKSFNKATNDAPTPFIDSILKNENSAYWHNYYANGVPTTEAFLSLHTSTLPHSQKSVVSSFIDIEFDTLPQTLKKTGYYSLYLSSAVPDWDNLRSWLNKSYDKVYYDPNKMKDDDQALFDIGIDMLGELDEPFLLTMTTINNHYPFTYDKAKNIYGNDNIISKLKNTMHYTDKALETFFLEAENKSWFKNTIIIIIGDHGYDLGERGEDSFGHNNLRHETTWVPLIITAGPNIKLPWQGRQSTVASHIDIAPTISGLAGDCSSNSYQGHSLIHRKNGEAFSMRQDNYAYENQKYSIFLNSDKQTFIYSSKDKLQTNLIIIDNNVHQALVRKIKDISELTDYVYDSSNSSQN